jgi:tuftelin-interacting protein 11
VVEEFCGEENLLLMPLREAHDVTGLPLFRITASATGRGGAVAYFKGDVLWVQNKKDKSLWEPTGLDEGLIAKAEGK